MRFAGVKINKQQEVQREDCAKDYLTFILTLQENQQGCQTQENHQGCQIAGYLRQKLNSCRFQASFITILR